MDFNLSQRNAICHGKGPALITAGPGSGKTTVIINHLLYLIRDLRANPEQILVVTFTKAAAQEMEERFRCVYQDTQKLPVFGTMHSIFYRILKNSGDPLLRIIPQKQQKELIRKELQRAGLFPEDPDTYTGKILNEISRMKNAMRTSDHSSSQVLPDLFPQILHSYQDFLEQNSLMDYDDILSRTKQLLSDREELLKKWQAAYQYILVDEFQDINLLQYQILKMLAFPRNNLFVVGDENQCIYGFRGSSPEFIKKFCLDYPTCTRIVLDVNYRCSETIIRRSCSLMEAGGIRFPVPIKAGTRRKDASFTLLRFHDQEEEANYLVRQIRRYQADKARIAVLVRSSREIPSLMQVFSESGISCTGRNKREDFRDHFIVQDILAYFRLALRKGSRQDLLRIANRPSRMISRTLLSDRTQEDPLEQLIASVQTDPVLRKALLKLAEDLAFLRQLTSFAGIEYLMHVMGYGAFLQQYAEEHGISPGLYDPVIARLKASAKAIPSKDLLLKQLPCTGQEERSGQNRQEGAVMIDTMHASKGMEYDVVFLPRLNKGIIPAGGTPDTSEERRILYVAMTRARSGLHLSYTEYINQKRVFPSVFVRDLLER